jgi:hypothetical protein
MRAANERDACTAPPPPTLPGQAHSACMQLLPTRWHAVAAPVHVQQLLSLRAPAVVPVGPAPPATAVRMHLCMHVGADVSEGTTFVCAHSPHLVMQH